MSARYSPHPPPRTKLSPRKVSPIRRLRNASRNKLPTPLDDLVSHNKGKDELLANQSNLHALTHRWLCASRAEEYLGINKEEVTAHLQVQQTIVRATQIKATLPLLNADLRSASSQLLTAQHMQHESTQAVAKAHDRWELSEAQCVLEAAHLMAPIRAALEAIAPIDTPAATSIFTVKGIKELIPDLPKKKAYITFDPDALHVRFVLKPLFGVFFHNTNQQ